MEYEISDDPGFTGDYELPPVRHRPVSPTTAPAASECRDRAVHIPEQES